MDNIKYRIKFIHFPTKNRFITIDIPYIVHRFENLSELTVATLHNVEHNRVTSDINKRTHTHTQII